MPVQLLGLSLGNAEALTASVPSSLSSLPHLSALPSDASIRRRRTRFLPLPYNRMSTEQAIRQTSKRNIG
eukprot:1625223-Pleurochrysis_carterae.AAC.3